MADDAELAREQKTLDRVYARLDHLRARTAAELTAVRRAGASGTHQNRSERDAFATMHEHRLAQLNAVEERLVFGRIDERDGARRYIGRIGISDEEQSQLLVDWRAPAARTFYQATAANAQDVVRRRHLTTPERQVVGIEDEVLDLDAISADERTHLAGEGALMAAVSARRTGRMGDIVATIQAEQDRIIRSDLGGALVVQGGPGTGKTAVALHRAAYLLYTYRERLERNGVLVVGPNSLFLRYIEQVLPSLGETGVVLSTAGQLYPGVDATADDSAEVAALKGDLRMARVVSRAVRERQRVPNGPRELTVDRAVLQLRPEVVASARSRARRTGKTHNAAREGFLKDLLNTLAADLARAVNVEFTADHREELLDDLRSSPDVRRELNLCWMPTSAEKLLRDLFADPAALERAAPDLTARERALLRRDRDAAWTVSDVPLLDEAAELLGDPRDSDRVADAVARAQRAEDLANARAALSNVDTMIRPSAEQLADRFAQSGPSLTVAERAEGDRTWAYGHLVVDEAQELSPMMWRLLFRRCPAKSMTLVGDVAQVGSAAGTSSWAAVLDRQMAGRWRVEELSVNYRTPAEVMEVATGLLRAAGLRVRPPQSVREAEVPPVAVRVAADDVTAAVTDVVRTGLVELSGGRLAVITADGREDALHDQLATSLPEGTVGSGRTTLDNPVSVLGATTAKGLEFDMVLVVEPQAIIERSLRGINDLYVALTRPTQRLVVVHSEDLPAGLDLRPPG